MLDQTLVRSGFDAEILLGERQLTYVLIGLIDAGVIPLQFERGGTQLGLRSPPVVDRTYTPDPAAPFEPVSDTRHPLEVEILFDHPLGADLRVHPVIDVQGTGIEADLFIALSLRTQPDDAGLLGAATLHVELVDLDTPALQFIETRFQIDKPTLLAGAKKDIDRDIDLGGFGAFKRIQDLAMRKLAADDGHPAALGVYVNLRLRQGPEPDSLKPARGSVDEALNFLPPGSDLAMASRGGLFADLANDAFQRFAEIDEQGHVSHPWHRSLHNPQSEVIGRIVGVSAGPLRDSHGQPLGHTLRIDVELEYASDSLVSPNVHLVIDLSPKTSGQGVMVWQIDADFHAGLLLEVFGFLVIASLFTFVGAIAGLGLAASIAAGLVSGSLVDALGHFVVDELYSGRVQKKVDAALPDVVSGRVELAQRRWDPLYTTHHQIAMRPDGAAINDQGVALWGRAVIDRRVEPLASAVIRDAVLQPPAPPTHLLYRVDDAESLLEDFEAVAPGTDRRDIVAHDPVGEPTLYRLEIAQVTARLAEGRIVPDLAYIARRVDVRQHQAHSLLAISLIEFNEQRNALIGAFEDDTRARIEAEQGDAIRADVVADFAGQGVTPTQEQIDAAVQARIDELLAGQRQAFVDGPLAGRLEQALRPLLRLRLAPEHFGALQRQRILHLLDLELIHRHDGLLYYRDHPDFFEPDNLLSLPRFRDTPQGPVLVEPGG